MAIPRYLWPDEYTKTELRAHLGSLPPGARIAFVEKLQHDVPAFSAHSIADIVAADDGVLFRAWAARTYGLAGLEHDKELLVRAAARPTWKAINYLPRLAKMPRSSRSSLHI